MSWFFSSVLNTVPQSYGDKNIYENYLTENGQRLMLRREHRSAALVKDFVLKGSKPADLVL